MHVTERVRTIKGHALALLADGHEARRVAGILRRDWGLRRRLAEHYVSAALVDLHRDTAQEPIDSVRARIVAMTHARLRSAIGRTRAYKLRQGNPDGSFTESLEREPDPNDDAALKAIWMLAQLSGVAQAHPLEPQRAPAATPLAPRASVVDG